MKNYTTKLKKRLSDFGYLFKAIKCIWQLNIDEYKTLYEIIEFEFGLRDI